VIAHRTRTNHYDRPIRNTEQQSDPFITVFSLQVHSTDALFYQPPANCVIMLRYKLFSLSQTGHVFHFSSSNFTIQGHILSTSGDALSSPTFFLPSSCPTLTWYLSPLHTFLFAYLPTTPPPRPTYLPIYLLTYLK